MVNDEKAQELEDGYSQQATKIKITWAGIINGEWVKMEIRWGAGYLLELKASPHNLLINCKEKHNN
jgi:hypothetical protein